MPKIELWTNPDGTESGISGETTISNKSSPRATTLFAKKFFAGRDDLVIAEIGVQRGLNAENILNELSPSLLVLVDSWDGKNEENNINFAETWQRLHGNQKIIIIKGESAKVSKIVNLRFDLVYIDAGHYDEDVRVDIEAWLPHMKRPGIISGHDYTNTSVPGVKRVADSFFGERIQSRHIEGEGGDWWVVL
jgi:hypothetical protein